MFQMFHLVLPSRESINFGLLNLELDIKTSGENKKWCQQYLMPGIWWLSNTSTADLDLLARKEAHTLACEQASRMDRREFEVPGRTRCKQEKESLFAGYSHTHAYMFFIIHPFSEGENQSVTETEIAFATALLHASDTEKRLFKVKPEVISHRKCRHVENLGQTRRLARSL